MNIIETLDHEAFTAYLKKYGNTICGRNPIGVLLGTIAAMRSGKFIALVFRSLMHDNLRQCAPKSHCLVVFDSTWSHAI